MLKKKKQRTVYQKPLKTNSRRKTRKAKEKGKMISSKCKQKERRKGLKLLTLNKVEFNIKSIKQDKEQHYNKTQFINYIE